MYSIENQHPSPLFPSLNLIVTFETDTDTIHRPTGLIWFISMSTIMFRKNFRIIRYME